MNRIDRLTAILTHLQGKSRTPIDELEKRFEVSERTIFRDIKALIEGGIPIGGDAGEGYFIVEGYHLPPVVFNKDEASALLIGSKLIMHHADAPISKNMDAAMHKVKSVLRYTDRDYLESIENNIEIIGTLPGQKQGFPDSYIIEIQTALASRKIIEITYHSNYNDQSTSRKVEPLGLVYYSNRWHLIGFCQLRQDLRDFRTDRVQKICITSEGYDPDSHPNFKDFVHGMTAGTDAKEVVLKFSKRISRFIGEQKYQIGFVEEKQLDDYVQMRFITPRYEFVAQWILGFLDNVEVVSPSELQGMVADYSKKLFEHHKRYFES